MFWGFGGSIAAAVVAYAFKPDTRYVLFCYFVLRFLVLGVVRRRQGTKGRRVEKGGGSLVEIMI